MSFANRYHLTEQDYLKGELNSEIKHELIDDEVFAMVGASATHNIISGNIFSELKRHLKAKPCRPYINDMKVKIAENFYYPDVLVDCSEVSKDTILLQPQFCLLKYYLHRPKVMTRPLNVSNIKI